MGYTWCTRTICFVRQPYVLYRSYTSLYVSHTPCTGRILRVPNLVHTFDHISPMKHRVYLVYTDYTLCTQPYVLCRSYASLYVSYTPCTGHILRVPNLVHTLDHISPMIRGVYLVYTDYMRCTSAIRPVRVV